MDSGESQSQGAAPEPTHDAGRSGQTPIWQQLLAQFVAVITVAVASVYFSGALVVGPRLSFQRLPTITVLGQLPREFLLSVGVVQVVLPAVSVAAVYVALRVSTGLG